MTIAERYGKMAEDLLQYVENKTTDLAAGVMQVPASHYTDPDRWAAEMELIFKRLPLLGGLSIEIPNPGDYKTIDILDNPVLITRLADGSVRAMLNICAHRAMAVAPEASGNCKRFTCRYHGWTYANDGRLLAIADAPTFGDVDKAAHGLIRLPVAERAGLIWIGLTPGTAMNIDDFLGDVVADLSQFAFETWYFVGWRDLAGANWKVAYDGYLEGYHFAAAHPQTIHPRTYSNVMHFEASGPHLRIGFPQVNIGQLRDLPRAEWGKRENRNYDLVRTIFPSVSIFVAPEITQIAQIRPGPTPDRNTTRLYYLRREPPKDEADKAALQQMADFFYDVVENEDYSIGFKVQKSLNAGALDHVLFGKNERGNQYFHRWIEHYLEDDPTRPPPAL
ncbi:MAG: (2Fe-2S)-binding protein [Alphaproteobacteria bacterium]|nr:MAG: (2Fe-2S)-binding protein [Alphaproteobacteria bacterium]